MQILQTAIFAKQIKKLHPNQKQHLDESVKTIMDNPQIGEMKKGDLNGVRVYKFRMVNQLTLLAYAVDTDGITLMCIGSHENFYRDMKK
jgi:hypothetical protein